MQPLRDIGMHAPAGSRADLAEGIQETISIMVVAKNFLAPIPSIQEVIERAGKLDSRFPGHDPTTLN
jgi:hypothetical protein